MPGLSGEVGEIRIVDICPNRFNSFQTLYCKGRCIIGEQSGATKNEAWQVGMGVRGCIQDLMAYWGDSGVSDSKCSSLVSLESSLEKQNLCFSPGPTESESSC